MRFARLRRPLPAAALLCLALTMGPALFIVAAQEKEVPRMTVEQLKEKIAGNEPLTIIDVRSQGAYDASDSKIKGAIRIPPDEFDRRSTEVPKDKEIVLYCT
jgi:hypothetical protein